MLKRVNEKIALQIVSLSILRSYFIVWFSVPVAYQDLCELDSPAKAVSQLGQHCTSAVACAKVCEQCLKADPMADPFAAHPELRPLIRNVSQSVFRNRDAVNADKDASNPMPPVPMRSAEAREASRRLTLSGHTGDLRVFAYGSLMWDPGMDFAEVRRAWLPGHARRFILCDIYGARGTHEAPGLMAALDRGDGCHGLAFRVPAENVEEETRILWAREMVLPSYIPRFLLADLHGESVMALAFLADHDSDMIRGDLTRDQQVRYLATGVGFLGSSRDYLETIARQFAALGIDDPDVSALIADVRAFAP